MHTQERVEILTTDVMKNHVRYLVFQLLSNFTEVRVEVPVVPGVASSVRHRITYGSL